MSGWNDKVIDEFRANGGQVGGHFAGEPLLLLHTVGARSGKPRVNPMMYQKVDGGYAVFASKAGAPTNPDWYHNLLGRPRVQAEIGTEKVELVARVAVGDERERIWSAQKAAYPRFAEYERKTSRQIPVVVLEPAP
ncbi:nitroreductase family deazaflavin-dependent oxidoreductase [Plantactinospora sp. WMMB782]|uniref:nitroreductase family deazaflavin-dependent oxidoreductase n=1 Tax=Plantactinospora sp. WMMB782 TaxID=3404121 RepID=UPI003B92816A